MESEGRRFLSLKCLVSSYVKPRVNITVKFDDQGNGITYLFCCGDDLFNGITTLQQC